MGFAQSGGSAGRGGFSNDWKSFFQWLENFADFFQRLEKFFGGFPMIGKNFRGTKGTKETTKRGGSEGCQTIMTISDNGFLH